MRTLNSYQVDRIERVAVQSMSDLCDIHFPIMVTQDTFGQNKKIFITLEDYPCGFNPSNTEKTTRGMLITEDCDAILRLPLGTTFSSKYEVTVSGIRFKVKGIALGKTVKRITLIRMDGSEQAS